VVIHLNFNHVRYDSLEVGRPEALQDYESEDDYVKLLHCGVII